MILHKSVTHKKSKDYYESIKSTLHGNKKYSFKFYTYKGSREGGYVVCRKHKVLCRSNHKVSAFMDDSCEPCHVCKKELYTKEQKALFLKYSKEEHGDRYCYRRVNYPLLAKNHLLEGVDVSG